MPSHKITPKNFILSMLQVSNKQAIPIKTLVECGELFGFTGNTIRVTITRLIREGTIESDERGLYRLSETKDLIRKFIDGWRLGEARIIPWDGTWISCLMPKQKASRLLRKGVKGLQFLGFQEGMPGFWIRPNNLKLRLSNIDEILQLLGNASGYEIFLSKDFREKRILQWKTFLWPIQELTRSLQVIHQKLQASANRLHKMPVENAIVESYLLGSEAVYCLNTDPLLPEEMMSGKYRIMLTQTMLVYDDLGKKAWKKKFRNFQIQEVPSHLRLITGV
ncbi:MAG: hypothetical protein C0403_15375 [Desulfobacterium sp.]|nr:hypothetical protein [Desulfobacterium sp.]